MANETVREGQGEAEGIQASGEALVIADAIYSGLLEIAGGLRSIAKALEGDIGDPVDDDGVYLDGSRK